MCRATSSWDNKETGSRDFSTISKMNDDMVNKINEVVMPDDVLFHLGDWSMGGYANIWKFRERLNVKEIHLILGNHDEHIKKNKMFVCDGLSDKAKELFTSVQDYLEIKVDGQLIVMSHFPIISWNEMYKGAWDLHGHTHGMLFANDKNNIYHKQKTLDVGIDNYYKLNNKYGIFSYRDIKKIMSARSFIKIDSHDTDTN